eukprot:CAMPEP_0177770102 /NCGR_PEP_ID=MMETSP0491_2-20121128/10727_1 /TAXON_ID=63592 /ORGANISM="Tetraselmis chuii, Strain PLY429" /LENGTH=324 /DNA_ID=CAMNT_0019287257 /DNA_START=286 /DNA_END=1260 /DNA_ORIENTATION=+
MATAVTLGGGRQQMPWRGKEDTVWEEHQQQQTVSVHTVPVRMSFPGPADFAIQSSPMMWRPHPGWALSSDASASTLPLNTERGIEFETPLFKGVAHMWVAGLPDSPGKQRMQAQSGNSNYQTLFTVRGRFLQEGLSHSDIITGQEFDRPIANVPGKWIINSAIAMGQQLMPSSDFGDLDNPYMLTPLICCGSLSLAEAEEGCSLADMPAPMIEEDCRILGPLFKTSSGKPAKEAVRKKAFGDAKKRSTTFFRTDLVYTFSFYQKYLDMPSLKFDLGYGLSFDMASHLDGQPFRMLCKQKSTGTYLWNFELWHKNLADRARERAA